MISAARLRSRLLSTALLVLLWSISPRGDAGDFLVSSRFSNAVLRFDGTTGQFKSVFTSGNGLANPNGIAIGPDGNVYVGLGDVGVVRRFDARTGAPLATLVHDDPLTPVDESGGLRGCRAIVFGPDGDLYVDAGSIDKVLRYDGRTGAFKGIAAEGNGMRGPVGLTFGPDGNLYVGAAISSGIYVFGPTGAFIRRLSCGDAVTGVVFGPDGFLYGASSVANVVRKYDPSSGQCLGEFAAGGGLSIPIGVGVSPDGNLLVGSFSTNSVIKYSFATGQPLGTFVAAGAGGLEGTHNFLFLPPDEAARKVVPIVLDVDTGSAHFSSELVLTNRSAAAAHVQLVYHPSLGTAGGAGAVDVTLGAGEQRVFADVLAELRTRGLAIPASGP
ncbi:MAG: NHL repeat-containing protein, partial [Thermoanaerobaculia bacterium]